MNEVKKVWGKEVWITNNELYCGKLLYIDKGAESSLHSHPKKQETFLCLQGRVHLNIDGAVYNMKRLSEPITIYPGQMHTFRGKTKAIILEVSTTHWDEDVERFTVSKPAPEKIKR